MKEWARQHSRYILRIIRTFSQEIVFLAYVEMKSILHYVRLSADLRLYKSCGENKCSSLIIIGGQFSEPGSGK